MKLTRPLTSLLKKENHTTTNFFKSGLQSAKERPISNVRNNQTMYKLNQGKIFI